MCTFQTFVSQNELHPLCAHFKAKRTYENKCKEHDTSENNHKKLVSAQSNNEEKVNSNWATKMSLRIKCLSHNTHMFAMK